MSFKPVEHNIQCIIGQKNSVNELFKSWVHAKRLDLTNAFGLIPLTVDLIADMDELATKGEDRAYQEFIALSNFKKPLIEGRL